MGPHRRRRVLTAAVVGCVGVFAVTQIALAVRSARIAAIRAADT